ncbi:MAG TPA: carboxypeptidase regulatory-like domain-containing protein [Acidobacteriaceae bacterium]
MIRPVAIASAMLVAGALAAQTIVSVPPPPPPPPPAPEVQFSSPQDAAPYRPSALSGPASFTISGIVVSTTTGTPLDRADVTLTTPGQFGSPIAETVTTASGGFRFDHLQAARYRLETSRRGYITAGYEDHDGFSTGIVTGPNLNPQGLRVALLPTAIIGGMVSDEAGDPVPGAQVRLYRQDQRSGENHVVGAGTDITDDGGSYEFARLRAGTYYISVSATPWYAFHPSAKTDDAGNILPADQQPHSPLDVAYSTTFYEAASDSDSATPLALNAGDHVDANFSLHAVPAIHMQIRLQAPGENRGLPMPQLVQQVFGAEQTQMIPQMMTTPSKGGSIIADIGGIAPGQYTLRQFPQQGESDRTATVDLASDLTVDFAAASAVGGVEVSGKVAMLSGEKIPNRARFTLIPADGDRPGREWGILEADGTFTLHNVAPGRYEVQIGSPNRRIAVTQMLASGAEVEGNHITVATEPVLMAATLASGATNITGYAKQQDKGVGGVMILLVPRAPNTGTDLYRRDQTNTDGSFTLNRVIPGNYTLVAIENGWSLDWGRREVVAPYLTRGIAVRITGQKAIELPSAVEIQPR